MSMRIEYYKDKNNEFRWRLKSENGNVVAVSGEGYRNSNDAKSGFKSLQRIDWPAQHLIEADVE